MCSALAFIYAMTAYAFTRLTPKIRFRIGIVFAQLISWLFFYEAYRLGDNPVAWAIAFIATVLFTMEIDCPLKQKQNTGE